jgi:hypothetical protein
LPERCKLDAETDEDLTECTGPSGLPQSTANVVTREFADAGTINLFCDATG